MREMTHDERIWLAAMLEGDGSLGTKIDGVPFIAVETSTFPQPVRARLLTGVGRMRTLRRKGKAVYHWEVNKTGDVHDIAVALRPHLNEKGAQADLLIDYTNHRLAYHGRITDEERTYRLDMFCCCKALHAYSTESERDTYIARYGAETWIRRTPGRGRDGR